MWSVYRLLLLPLVLALVAHLPGAACAPKSHHEFPFDSCYFKNKGTMDEDLKAERFQCLKSWNNVTFKTHVCAGRSLFNANEKWNSRNKCLFACAPCLAAAVNAGADEAVCTAHKRLAHCGLGYVARGGSELELTIFDMLVSKHDFLTTVRANLAPAGTDDWTADTVDGTKEAVAWMNSVRYESWFKKEPRCSRGETSVGASYINCLEMGRDF